jgi:hypothetical protein
MSGSDVIRAHDMPMEFSALLSGRIHRHQEEIAAEGMNEHALESSF